MIETWPGEVGFHYVNTDWYLQHAPSPQRSAYHPDGETFDRYLAVAGEGVRHQRYTWVAERALWQIRTSLLPDGAWTDGGWLFECLGPWHADPRDCARTDALHAGECATLDEALAAWAAWLDQERQDLAACQQRLADLTGDGS